MTFDEAIKQIGLIPCEWKLVPFLGVVRAIRNAQGQCPLEALAGVPPGNFFDALETLNLEPTAFTRIGLAADAWHGNWTPEDRHALMVACGLEITQS